HAFRDSIDPIPERAKLMTNCSFAASWLLRCVSKDASGIWRGLLERDPEFLPNLFALLHQGRKQTANRRVLLWVEQQSFTDALRVVDCEHWSSVSSGKLIRDYLPCPSEQWT